MCLQMGRPSICFYLAKGETGGAWICSNCWRCGDDCPHDVDLFAVMMGQRHMEPPPRAIAVAIRNITTLGCAFRIEGLDVLRETHGLRPVRMIGQEKLAHLLGKRQDQAHAFGARRTSVRRYSFWRESLGDTLIWHSKSGVFRPMNKRYGHGRVRRYQAEALGNDS